MQSFQPSTTEDLTTFQNRLCDLVDRLDFPNFFKEISLCAYEYEIGTFNLLRKEFMQKGQHSIDFSDRLKVFAQSLCIKN
jgi:hypothetical protein